VLDGSNDVNSSNRGIQVSDPDLGQVQVEWGAFESIRFQPAPDVGSYGRFDGGHRLRGTVVTESGDRVTGEIRWDNDESGPGRSSTAATGGSSTTSRWGKSARAS
jgi:hypothetical protein